MSRESRITIAINLVHTLSYMTFQGLLGQSFTNLPKQIAPQLSDMLRDNTLLLLIGRSISQVNASGNTVRASEAAACPIGCRQLCLTSKHRDDARSLGRPSGQFSSRVIRRAQHSLRPRPVRSTAHSRWLDLLASCPGSVGCILRALREL